MRLSDLEEKLAEALDYRSRLETEIENAAGDLQEGCAHLWHVGRGKLKLNFETQA